MCQDCESVQDIIGGLIHTCQQMFHTISKRLRNNVDRQAFDSQKGLAYFQKFLTGPLWVFELGFIIVR